MANSFNEVEDFAELAGAKALAEPTRAATVNKYLAMVNKGKQLKMWGSIGGVFHDEYSTFVVAIYGLRNCRSKVYELQRICVQLSAKIHSIAIP